MFMAPQRNSCDVASVIEAGGGGRGGGGVWLVKVTSLQSSIMHYMYVHLHHHSYLVLLNKPI